MRVIKFDRFIIDKPFFDNNPQRSTTDNQSYRKVLIMVFKDNYGCEFYFLPKWNDVLNLNIQAVETEVLNKKLLKENLIERC